MSNSQRDLKLAREPEQPSPSEIEARQKAIDSLENAVDIICKVTGDDISQSVQFQKALKANNAGNINDPSYWHTLRKFVSFGNGSWLKELGYNDQDLESIALLTYFPIFIHAQKTLEYMENYLGEPKEPKNKLSDAQRAIRDECKRVASTFNDKLGRYVEQNPDIHVEDLERSFIDIMDLYISYDEIDAVLNEYIKPTLIGMQVEVAFGQILEGIKSNPEYPGFDYRPSTIDEDIGQGTKYPGQFFDYEITLGEPIITKDGIMQETILIDIKSSKVAIENNKTIGMISKKPKSDTYIIATVPLRNTLAKTGKFFVSTDELEKLIPFIYDILENRDSLINNNNPNKLSN